MGFDEPVTHSVPATLGPGTPLTEAEETMAAALHAVRPGIVNGARVTAKQVLGVLRANGWTLDAARAATRVEADLRAEVARFRRFVVEELASERGEVHMTVDKIVARYSAFYAATEAPREVWTDVPGHGDTQYSPRMFEPGYPLDTAASCFDASHRHAAPSTEDRDEPIALTGGDDPWDETWRANPEATMSEEHGAMTREPEWVDSIPPDERGKHCFDCGQFYPEHFDICWFASPVNEWRHRQLDPANDSRCHADLQPWPCDAETERNARLAAEHALGSAARIANESMAEARAAEGERDAALEAVYDAFIRVSPTGTLGRGRTRRPAIGTSEARAYLRRVIDEYRAALTGAKE